jgi:hypothetical protein
MGFLMDFVILMKPHPHNIFKLFVLYLVLSHSTDEYFTASAEIVAVLVAIAPTSTATKSDNRSQKTLQLKLSNKPKNELNKH